MLPPFRHGRALAAAAILSLAFASLAGIAPAAAASGVGSSTLGEPESAPAIAPGADGEPEVDTLPQPTPETDTAPYIVQTVSTIATEASSDGADVLPGQIEEVFDAGYTGFAAELTAEQVAELDARSDVVAVTPDSPTRAADTDLDPAWGLDRIDQRATAGNGAYSYGSTGAGVTVFVIDTGIRATHREFSGRVVSGWDFVDGDPDASDCSSHGTHVSGTIAGEEYGVARDATLVSLRVWGCDDSGWARDVIAALDWAVQHKPAGPAVVNISGGGAGYAPMDAAVRAAVAAGLTVVVAALNADQDACLSSPARVAEAITVGATDPTDARASFSNFGSCVDVFAPGVDIQSSIGTSDSASESWSGTSMAAPHVTGAVARILQENPSASPAAVASTLLGNATPGVIRDAKGSPNLLLYSAPPVLRTLTSTPIPTLAGKMKLGETLTGATGSWAPSGVTLSLQWMRNGIPIPAATKPAYRVVAADLGTSLSLSVTGSKTGFTSVTRASAAKSVPVGAFTTTAAPVLSGTLKVGGTLTAAVRTWKPAAALTLQWKRNGVAIPNATRSAYTLLAGDVGAAITVSATGSAPGYAPVTMTSAATTLRAATLTATSTPKIVGTAKLGQRLSVTAGSWAPAGVQIVLQWKRNGVAIPGATGASYTVVAADAGRSLTVSATGGKPGFASVTKTSAAASIPKK